MQERESIAIQDESNPFITLESAPNEDHARVFHWPRRWLHSSASFRIAPLTLCKNNVSKFVHLLHKDRRPEYVVCRT